MSKELRAIRKWSSARECMFSRLFIPFVFPRLFRITGWNITTICTRGLTYNALIPYCMSNNVGARYYRGIHRRKMYDVVMRNMWYKQHFPRGECMRVCPCYTVIRTPCLFISWLRKTVYSLSCCLSSPQLSSSDVPRSSRVDSHNFSLILPWILLLCVRASSLYHWSSPVLGISCTEIARIHMVCFIFNTLFSTQAIRI